MLSKIELKLDRFDQQDEPLFLSLNDEEQRCVSGGFSITINNHTITEEDLSSGGVTFDMHGDELKITKAVQRPLMGYMLFSGIGYF